jgi:hypothetical protein
MSSPISINNSDVFGREGQLDIENQKISTPNYIPTRSEFLNLQESPFIDKKDYSKINFGVYGYWINDSIIKRISDKGKAYQNIKNYINERIKIVETPVRMLHFEFNSDVSRLNTQTLKLLLDLQVEVGANIIEIPNLQKQRNYKKSLEKAIEWKKANADNHPLMGIAYEPSDVKILKSKITQIDSIGIHIHSENLPLLYEIEETIRPLNVWTHAFSAPRSYKKVNYKGTMGVFLNKFGIDTMSTYVATSEVARNFSYAKENKTDIEKQNDALANKYFNPIDYSTTKYEFMNETLNPDDTIEIKLSNYCSCPVCKNNTLQSIVSDYNTTFQNTRSHEVLANVNESVIIKERIKKNEFDKYLSSKKFAYTLTQRSQSKLQS